MEPAKDPLVLPDTVRNGVHYKRITFPLTKSNETETRITAYFRCDKTGTLFQFNKALTRRMGCPMTRYESVSAGENPFIAASEIDFVRASLTVKEMKIFTAWERNAKINPVVK